jgi:hypothetical protein
LADRHTGCRSWEEFVFARVSRIFKCSSDTVKLQHMLWADAQGGVVQYGFALLFFEWLRRLILWCSGGTFVAFGLLCLSAAYMQGEADDDLTSV